MNEQLEEILEAEITMKKVISDYGDLVKTYIKQNVDKNSWKSLDKAILDLPECKEKLPIYDWMYDLQEKNK